LRGEEVVERHLCDHAVHGVHRESVLPIQHRVDNLGCATATPQDSASCNKKAIANAIRMGVWSSQGWLGVAVFGRRPHPFLVGYRTK
jgi:hypothetical protein